MTDYAQKNIHTISHFTKCCYIVMISYVSIILIDIEHMQSVNKVFFVLFCFDFCFCFCFSQKIATILVIWKPSDSEIPS